MVDTKIVSSSVIESATFHNVSRDKTGRSKWSHELVENLNAIDGFFKVISVVRAVYKKVGYKFSNSGPYYWF